MKMFQQSYQVLNDYQNTIKTKQNEIEKIKRDRQNYFDPSNGSKK